MMSHIPPSPVSPQQEELMPVDPAYGTTAPYPSHAGQYRKYHGQIAWLFNPWTGGRRNPNDIGSDPFGHLIVPSKLGVDGCVSGYSGYKGNATKEVPLIPADRVEAKAKELYDAETNNHPTIHCNRFSPWSELSDGQRDVYRQRALDALNF